MHMNADEIHPNSMEGGGAKYTMPCVAKFSGKCTISSNDNSIALIKKNSLFDTDLVSTIITFN